MSAISDKYQTHPLATEIQVILQEIETGTPASYPELSRRLRIPALVTTDVLKLLRRDGVLICRADATFACVNPS